MGILTKILGGGLASPIEAVGKIIDDLHTSDEEKLTKEEILTRLAQKPHLVQAEINKVEAQHRSIFVAGWRPFIGWVCGAALAWKYLFYDVAAWIAIMADATPPPQLEGAATLTTLVMSLLGLGALRTVEKLGGRAK